MNENPLAGLPVEVPLPRAPLIRVIAQVRFPLIASVENRDFIAPFQEAIREEYPILRQESTGNLVVAGPGQVAVRTGNIWRFHALDHPWRVSLTGDFLAIETEHYTSRQDFLDRFEKLLIALERHVKPGVLDRLGVRYVDRLTGSILGDLAPYVNPALLGVLGSPMRDQVAVAVGEALLALPEEAGQMRARWGLLPPDTTVDPSTIAAINDRSWVLDIDAFQQGERRFVGREVAAQARRLARATYAFFRWATTDDFLRHYGGTP